MAWTEEKEKELQGILERGNWLQSYGYAGHEKTGLFVPLKEDEPRYFQLIDEKSAARWQEYRGAAR